MTEKSLYENRAELLVAIMTKDYEKAEKLGRLTLQQSPNDTQNMKLLIALCNQFKNSKNVPDAESNDECDSETDNEENDLLDKKIFLDDKNYFEKGLYGHISNANKNNFDFKDKMYRVIRIHAKKQP